MRIYFYSSLILFLLFPFFVFAADKVEINTASLQQLDTLTGIGLIYAQAIIDARPFSSIDDLIRVKGIGEKTLQKIKDQGLAYVENDVGITDTGQTPAETSQNPPEPIVVQIETTPVNNSSEAKPPLTGARPPQTYPSGIILNEILPSPEGPDETEEWVEVFNQNNFEVNLSKWRIKDNEGKITTYTLPDNTEIEANGYLLLTRPQTKIILNNTGDKLTLLQPDGKIVDTVIYEKSALGQSYNRTDTGWSWSSILTPGSKNSIADNNKQEDTAKIKENIIKNEQTAASLNQIIAGPKSFLFIFLIALGIAVSSAIIFFLLKNKV